MWRLKKVTTRDGFTIIETIIVLAIAGFMLMLVFEIIPTLDRSSRNNLRKQDVSAMLQAVSKWELNNSGGFPGNCGDTAGDLCNAVPTGHNIDPFYYINLRYYDDSTQGNVEVTSWSACSSLSCTSVANPNNIQKVVISNYQKCDPLAYGQATSQGAGYNDIVALYTLEEDNGSTSPQCEDLSS